MAELADAADSKSAGTWYLGGSTPPPGTTSELLRCSVAGQFEGAGYQRSIARGPFEEVGPEDAAFLDILQGLETTNPNFRLIATMTEMARSKKTWDGETRRIDQEMLSRHVGELRGPIYYIAGPAMGGGHEKNARGKRNGRRRHPN